MTLDEIGEKFRIKIKLTQKDLSEVEKAKQDLAAEYLYNTLSKLLYEKGKSAIES